jgi:hypothetical protein
MTEFTPYKVMVERIGQENFDIIIEGHLPVTDYDKAAPFVALATWVVVLAEALGLEPQVILHDVASIVRDCPREIIDVDDGTMN